MTSPRPLLLLLLPTLLPVAGPTAARARVDPLTPFLEVTVRGGMAVGATCINHQPPEQGGPTGGEIALDLPEEAVVEHAFLYWSVLSDTFPVSTGSPSLGGTPLAPVQLGTVLGSPCFDQTYTSTFRADVTALIDDPGPHVLAGFPGTGTNEDDLTEGATLFVVFCEPGRPLTDVVLWDGVDVTETADEPLVQEITGFRATSSGDVEAVLAVAAGNGQGRPPPASDVDPFVFNGVDLDELDPTILSGASCPPGGLYDLTLIDVSQHIALGSTSAMLVSAPANDCHSWAALALAVTTDRELVASPAPEPSALDQSSVTPLTVERARDGLSLQWEDLGDGIAYHVRSGSLGSFEEHDVVGACTREAAAAIVAEVPGDRYYLITAVDCPGVESSAGRDSFGRERTSQPTPESEPCP